MPPKPDDKRPSIGRIFKNRGRNLLSKILPAPSTSQNSNTQESDSNTADVTSASASLSAGISRMGLVSGNDPASTHTTALGAIRRDHTVGSDMSVYVLPGSVPLTATISSNATSNATVHQDPTLSSEVSKLMPTVSSSRADQVPGDFLSNVSPPTADRTAAGHMAASDMDPSRLTRPSAPMGLVAGLDHNRITDGAMPPTSPSNGISVFHGSSNTQFINSILMVQQTQITAAKPLRSAMLQQIPLKPEIFHGRDGLCEEIAQLLTKKETSRVCILGPGGMGKTSVSLAVVELPLVKERFPPGNCVWVPCIEATSATLLLEILYVQLQVPGDTQVTLEKIISELDASNQPRLILLDNFETPWNAPGGTQKQVSDILRRLAMLSHVAILVTMRGTYPPCDAIEWQSRTIQPTDEAACRRIFNDINPSSKDDPDIGRLLAVLGHMPFAVTLMANLGKRGKSTVKELLDTWYTCGTDMLSVTNSPEKSMNRSISLSVDSEFVKQDPDALLLLAILSLLPAGTTKHNLHWWAPTITMIPSAIATLSDAALLVENKQQDSDSPVLFVLPVVQSFMQQHDRIAEEIRKQVQSSCCQYILTHSCHYNDPAVLVKTKALTAEDTNIQSILFSSPMMQHTILSDRTMDTLIAFSWHRCDTKPNLEIANHTVTAAKASRNERYIALAVWCLGKTYQRLGDYHAFYNHLQEAYQLFNALPPGEAESQQLGGRCGIDLVEATRMTSHDVGTAVSLARDVEMKCATLSDDLVHGRSLVLLGSALDTAGQRKEALVHLARARTMLMAVGNTPNLAAACQIIARVHYHDQRLLEALDAIEEAWKHAELIDGPFIHWQALISLEFVMILFSANRDTEAWKHIDLALMNGSQFGNQLYIAHALQYMGYGYLRRGDYENAYGAFGAAAEKYLSTNDADGEKRCKDNMARIKQKQGSTDVVVGFHRHSFDVDESLFYPPVQASATNVPISGS